LTREFGVADGDRHTEPEGFPAISRLARKAPAVDAVLISADESQGKLRS